MFENIRIEKGSSPENLLDLVRSVGWNQTLSDCEEMVLRNHVMIQFKNVKLISEKIFIIVLFYLAVQQCIMDYRKDLLKK